MSDVLENMRTNKSTPPFPLNRPGRCSSCGDKLSTVERFKYDGVCKPCVTFWEYLENYEREWGIRP